MDVDGGNVRRLTSSVNLEIAPAWVPGLRLIVFELMDTSHKQSLYLISDDGTGQELVPISSNYGPGQPAWSRAGS